MVFNVNTVFLTLLIVTVIWTCILTAWVVALLRHYNRLVGQTSKTGMRDILDSILNSQNDLKKYAADIEQVVKTLSAQSKSHVQRIGIVRFNPFSDTGGSQSFTIAMLDANDNGIVMTSLYTRSGNRWYVKEVRAAKGKDFELAKEEEAAIKKAHQIAVN